MLITRIPPSVAELVARALADTAFLTQITGVEARHVATFAEIAASLAAEGWEAERHTLIGMTLPTELISDVAEALVAHAADLQVVQEAALFAATMKVERALSTLAAARTALTELGALPLPAAEAILEDSEHHLDLVRIAYTRALGVLHSAIGRFEAAALRKAV